MKNILFTLSLILFASLGLNAQEYHLGQLVTNPDGSQGVVFYLNEEGTSGWMVALHDASTYCPWGPTGPIDGLNDLVLVNNDHLASVFLDNDGYSHTQSIRAHCESSGYAGPYAAGVVDFENGWYLPSAGQLKWLYVNAVFYEPALQSVGQKMGLSAYWSSSVENNGKAWYVQFGAPYALNAWAWNGYYSSIDRESYYDHYDRAFAVRAIRDLDFSPLPTIGQLQTPAVICDEGPIALVLPNLHNVNSYGWEIAEDEAFLSPIAYLGQNIDTAYNGWYLRLWASNEEGMVYSNVVRLSVYESNNSSFMVSSCGPYVWNNQIFNESGVYQATFVNQGGCDSIATLFLNVGHNIVTNQAVNTCDSYTWNGTTYTESGLYEQIFTSAQGCDSIVVLDLTIRGSSYVSPIHGDSLIYYQATGSYTYNIDPVPGCFGYEWSIDGPWRLDASSNSPECTVNINVTGNGTLKVRVYTECGVIERSLFINHDTRPDVVIYPNPTIGDFDIVLSGMTGQTFILIYNYLGQFIDRLSLDTDMEGTVVPYTLTGKAAGVYYIRVFNNSNTITKMVIKEKPATYGRYNW
jgi:hypothetical protein